jgi:hypothetical protein
MVNFKVLKYYVFTCKLIGVTPSFDGLERFRVFCLLECEHIVRD